MSHLYQALSQRIAAGIDQGLYRPGERLPGIRTTSRDEGVSPATVVAAYQTLEENGYLEARPRSGFFVKPQQRSVRAEPSVSRPLPQPSSVTGQQLVLDLLRNISRDDVVQLGANVADARYLPTATIARASRRVVHQHQQRLAEYEAPPGLPELRGLLADRMSNLGCATLAEDVVVTAGCQEAVHLALKSVTQPGDLVAIESPTYYGLLQALDSLGLKALEIPTHPRDGMSIPALQLALQQWPVRACVLVANFSNPMGGLMPERHRDELASLLAEHPEVTLIEDDIYGDLAHSAFRPSLLRTTELDDRVIYCSSFSKSLSAGLRVGWAVSRQYAQQLAYEKFVSSCVTSVINQLVTVELLRSGGYERHLRGMRVALAQNVARLTAKVAEHFPASCRITRPQGGMAIWVELPRGVDTTELFYQAVA
ncbi:MAG: PLP-dependent aminotransferase family protein, partial [Pseudomonadota bacterium]